MLLTEIHKKTQVDPLSSLHFKKAGLIPLNNKKNI